MSVREASQRRSLLDHPEAQALLADAEVSADAVRGCRDRLQRFLQRYLPLFYRHEQRELAEVVLQGRLSNLQRKTSEPIAYLADRARKPVQHFVGAGCWDDEAVMAELRREVAEVLADPEAVLVLDPSGFPKKGTASCGVNRQWCGRLGKVDNCQLGVFVAYVSVRGWALVDRRLYLPEDWAADAERRAQTHVPVDIVFQETWRIGLELLDRVGPRERLVVLRTVDGPPQTWYTLSNALAAIPVAQVACAHGRRHGVEEALQAGKGEVGLGHYEVRSWVGWHHHMTLSLLALWFLQTERLRLGGKNAGGDGAAGAGGVHGAAAGAAAGRGADRGGGERGAAA